VADIRDAAVADAEAGSDPEDFWALAGSGLCDVRVTWSPRSARGEFDVTLSTPGRADAFSPVREASHAVAVEPLSTDPLGAAVKQQWGLELRQTLSDALPADSVPVAVLVVNALPQEEPAVVEPPAAGDLAWPRRAQRGR
jgi:hypothetical protein